MSTRYGTAALIAEARMVRDARKGERHTTLNRAAFNLGSLVGSGDLDEATAEGALLDAALCCFGASGDSPGEMALEAMVRTGIEAGRARPRATRHTWLTRDEALGAVEEIVHAALDDSWSGHQGNRMYTTLLGALAIAYQVGGPRDVPLSRSRLSITSGLSSHRQLDLALGELVDFGWLTRVGYPGMGHAARYDIQVPKEMRSGATSTQPTTSQVQWPHYAPIGHDATHRDALGRTAARIHERMAREPDRIWNQANLARATGLCASTVSRHLRPHRLLIKLGLVERDGRRIWAAMPHTDATMDMVADAAGTTGTRDTRRARLAEYFKSQGILSEDMRWIDPRTGDLRGVATWLLAEYPRVPCMLPNDNAQPHEVGP